MILYNDPKRLVIYFFYDRDGIVDGYIPYLLKDMKENVSEILFVSNGDLTEESRQKLEGIVDEILERPNVGFDVWAYKEALEHIGWKRLSTDYDEVILMNYTIMGPVYPFREMFETMDKKDLDFWGMTYYHKYDSDPFGKIDIGYIPLHLQSHFHVYRRSLLISPSLKEYWDNMPAIESYSDSVAYHETLFTRYFDEKGFKYEAYVDTFDMEELNVNLILFAPVELMRQKRCPVFKRRSFMHNYEQFLNESLGEPTLELMRFLEEETEYDTDLIWENILRCYDMETIKKCLHLNYILPREESARTIEQQSYKKKKIALVFHAYFPDLAESTLHYVNSMPAEADVYITTNTAEKKELFEKLFEGHKFRKLEVIQIENRGRDVSALLVGVKHVIMDYDYVCFAHDKKVGQIDPKSIGAGFAYHCLENVLGSEGYVRNVIQKFEDNPRMGLLTPPPPSHSNYFLTLGVKWGPNFDITWVLYDKLGLKTNISREVMPVAPLGTMFWFRPEGMKKLFAKDWEYEDFPPEPNGFDGTLLHAIERIYGICEQDAGFYTAYGLVDYFASIYTTNLEHMLSQVATTYYDNGMGGTFYDLVRKDQACIEAMTKIKEAGDSIFRLFPREFTQYGSGKYTKLYYASRGDFTEQQTVRQGQIRKGYNEFCFSIPPTEKPLRMLRFDPGESGNILVEYMTLRVIPDEGSSITFGVEDCITNGLICRESAYFANQDPILIVPIPTPVKVKEVRVAISVILEPDSRKIAGFFKGYLSESKPSLFRKVRNKLRRMMKK